MIVFVYENKKYRLTELTQPMFAKMVAEQIDIGEYLGKSDEWSDVIDLPNDIRNLQMKTSRLLSVVHVFENGDTYSEDVDLQKLIIKEIIEVNPNSYTSDVMARLLKGDEELYIQSAIGPALAEESYYDVIALINNRLMGFTAVYSNGKLLRARAGTGFHDLYEIFAEELTENYIFNYTLKQARNKILRKYAGNEEHLGCVFELAGLSNNLIHLALEKSESGTLYLVDISNVIKNNL